MSPYLYGLKSVLYLKESSLWTKRIHTTIVFASCEKHGISSKILARKLLPPARQAQHVT